MSLYGVCILFSLLWTMCFVAVLIESNSTSYQFYEPIPIQESQSLIQNLIVTEEELIQPTPSIVPKHTLLQHTLQNEQNVKVLEKDNHYIHDELHTLHSQLCMIHRQLRVIERNYHHMEQKMDKGKDKKMDKGVSKEKVKEIKKQYQDLRESYLYTKKRLRQLKKSVKN